MGQKLLSSAYKREADQWFYLRLRQDGMIDFRALAWYKAVQLFGIPKYSADRFKSAPIPFESELPPDINKHVGLIQHE
jgi:hypothetical protein